ncbi:hypothetical protein GbCGDNIH1_10000 [Granulibacter bethesdensis CGDNIH1]|uniref:Uncharacterized protein n=1 Tax=Granulibacter bethesdensis (strain ATCC BAA-1260 / CGDNIH1) TaxID=391165 RepID=A0A286M2V0_GRABC|nr:hypothetical protein GbCGDNIH5_10000 [Granulibacter bethesdensis]ASV62349.1 hypothetical protein GbCGDNIH1_10000 [Granulibacter bethesdensis CGDNIH1]ASV62540.1 hypothetical protein GbCGDNIH1I4_10000 [Granulibacter bethesdensis]
MPRARAEVKLIVERNLHRTLPPDLQGRRGNMLAVPKPARLDQTTRPTVT